MILYKSHIICLNIYIASMQESFELIKTLEQHQKRFGRKKQEYYKKK